MGSDAGRPPVVEERIRVALAGWDRDVRAHIGEEELRWCTFEEKARLILLLLIGWTDRVDEDRLLDILVSCCPDEIDTMVQVLEQRSLLHRCFTDVHMHNHGMLLHLLAYHLTTPEGVALFLRELRADWPGIARDRARAACLGFAAKRGDLDAIDASCRERWGFDVGPATPGPEQAYPFRANWGGRLSAPRPFEAFLDHPPPTDLQLRTAASEPLLDYFATGRFGEFTGAEGTPIRYAVFDPDGGQTRALIVFSAGRAEAMVKYSETLFDLRDLRRRGVTVAILDHRGQGFSGRELAPEKGYVQEFDHYVRDLHSYVGLLRRYFPGAPLLLVGHSMGAAIALAASQADRDLAQGLVLLSPMLNIDTGIADRFEGWVARAGSLVAGRTYALGKGEYRARDLAEGHTLCAKRHDFGVALVERFPELRLGGPTWQWLHEAIDAGRRIVSPDGVRRLEGLPIRFLLARGDTIVQNETTVEFAARLGVQERVFDDVDEQGHPAPARHEMLMGGDALRGLVLDEIRDALAEVQG